MPQIATFSALGRDLTDEPRPRPRPKPSFLHSVLNKVASALPHHVRARKAAHVAVRKALHASQSAGATDRRAEVLWKQACARRDDVYFQDALEQPVRGHATAIEALLSTRNWRCIEYVADALPCGTYAGGRVFRANDWFGSVDGRRAHGVVVGQGTFRAFGAGLGFSSGLFGQGMGHGSDCVMEAHYAHGLPDGPCSYVSRLQNARLEVAYERGRRVGDAAYVSHTSSAEASVLGSWVGDGVEAMPQNATLTLTGPKATFHGKVDAVNHDKLRPATILSGHSYGVVTKADGVSTTVAANGPRFEGCSTLMDAGTTRAWMSRQGTLTLPQSPNPHCGSEDVARGHVTGTWKDADLTQGCGEITMHDGTFYAGGFGDGGALHGEGVLIWPSGARYEGTFDHGYLQDQGTLTWADGHVTRGMFSRTPTWQRGLQRDTCDVAFGDGAGERFWFDAHGQPDPHTRIRLC